MVIEMEEIEKLGMWSGEILSLIVNGEVRFGIVALR